MRAPGGPTPEVERADGGRNVAYPASILIPRPRSDPCFSPHVGEFAEPILSGEREPDRRGLVGECLDERDVIVRERLVRDLGRLSLDPRAAGRGRPVEGMRMLRS